MVILNRFGGSALFFLQKYLKGMLKPFLHRTIILLTIVLTCIVGCSTVELEEAFKGRFSPVKNNKTINNYCQSCHIHRDFNPGQHVFEIRKIYKRSLYRSARECRICHYIERIWALKEMLRKTRYPYSIDRGLFRKFEQKEIERIKKKKKSSKSPKSLFGL